jgi:hypothetical protein
MNRVEYRKQCGTMDKLFGTQNYNNCIKIFIDKYGDGGEEL